ncbi:MAG: protein-L-isoaspartate(D-aspartate) O-methyltransferase [bacterium]
MSGENGDKAREWARRRRSMVEHQLRSRGIRDERVLEAMSRVPRHRFVPEALQDYAYEDGPLGIGEGQTISQPYMVALMTECLDPQPQDHVLEIGTGSGYQTAVLAELVREVHSVERLAELADRASFLLSGLGYRNVWLQVGDGTLGVPERAPFQGILVTAGAPEVPAALLDQLAVDGRLVIPIGSPYHQTLYKVVREAAGHRREAVTGCVFVPLIGVQGWEG